VPVMIWSNVDLPEPFGPMMPVVVPASTSKLMSLSAQNSRCAFQWPRVMVSFKRSAGRS